MIFREMSQKIETAPRVAAEEAKKRKDQHEDSDEALVDGGDEVYVAPSRKARKVSIEPDARHTHGQPGDRWSRVGRTSMNCSLFDTNFCHDKPESTCSRINSKAPAPHKPEGRDPDHQDCD